MKNNKIIDLKGLEEYNQYNPFAQGTKVITDNNGLETEESIVLGQENKGKVSNSIIIGNKNAINNYDNNIIIGNENESQGDDNIILGHQFSATNKSRIALGPIVASKSNIYLSDNWQISSETTSGSFAISHIDTATNEKDAKVNFTACKFWSQDPNKQVNMISESFPLALMIAPDGTPCYGMSLYSGRINSNSGLLYYPNKMTSVNFVQQAQNCWLNLKYFASEADVKYGNIEVIEGPHLEVISAIGKNQILHYVSGYQIYTVWSGVALTCPLDVYIWYEQKKSSLIPIKLAIPESLGRFFQYCIDGDGVPIRENLTPSTCQIQKPNNYNYNEKISDLYKLDSIGAYLSDAFAFFMQDLQVISFEME